MKPTHPLLLAAAGIIATVCVPLPAPAEAPAEAPAQAAVLYSVPPVAYDRTELDARAETMATTPPAAVLETTPLSLRLAIWGDLFTPSEQASLKTFSEAFSAARGMERVESSSATIHANELSRGPASATAISSSLIFGGQGYGGWGAPVSWGQPGNSIGRAFGRELVPMGSDWAERSRGANWRANQGSTATFFEEAVAILPGPRGGNSVQAGTDALRLGVISFISGDWPEFGRMTAEDYSRFCRIWIKRTLNAVISTEMGELMTPRTMASIPQARQVAAERGRAPIPIATFHFGF